MEEEWKEFRKSVYENKLKSEDDFEKYITFISSGALGLSMVFIEKIVPIGVSKFNFIIIIGWILLAISLFANLLSHFFSRKYSEATIEDLDKELEYEVICVKINRRNKFLEVFNITTISTLFIGIVLIIIFVSFNLNMMSENKPSYRPNSNPKPATEEKGRIIPKPPQIKPRVPQKK